MRIERLIFSDRYFFCMSVISAKTVQYSSTKLRIFFRTNGFFYMERHIQPRYRRNVCSMNGPHGPPAPLGTT